MSDVESQHCQLRKEFETQVHLAKQQTLQTCEVIIISCGYCIIQCACEMHVCETYIFNIKQVLSKNEELRGEKDAIEQLLEKGTDDSISICTLCKKVYIVIVYCRV